ncbi:2Fe-2S iron-sulfur cluster-binding protein [Streptomyces sp. NBC_01465]|uniref:2Fe-2S iron-sulfur cluster-binding protein n=1 Tax=Streptomyces sp. NBC_01465 TaxID=2903878 RepID=UPI002E3057CC|nr:2Fe-2S iron-sulfur cluster-binding protein [Streptomyces sp. NBC_01465]
MTTNDENHEQQGGWQPVPQGGEYDSEATAFVQLPAYPEDMDWAGPAGSPLAAPGHGYVPPMILPLTPAAGTDPAATGSWSMPVTPQAPQWPEPEPAPAPVQDQGLTGQWTFSEPEPEPTASDLTGQWTIPVAGGEVPEDSGEFTMSTLRGPATLPGGAAAPWAVRDEPAGDFDPRPTHPDAEPAPAPWPTPAATDGTPPEGTPVPEFTTHQAPPTLPGGAPAPWAVAGGGTPAQGTPVPDETFTAVEETPVEEARPAPVPEPESAVPVPAPVQEQVPAEEPEPEADVPGPEPEADLDLAAEPEAEPALPAARSEHTPASYVLRVNGADRPVTDAWIGESLLYVLRERLGLAGAKDGCSQGECGACNVQVDGRLVASCLVPAATAAGSEVRTVEGLATDGEPSDVQRALAQCGAVQCGFCIPGMAMTVHDLLEGNHAPTELETRQALCGNLCRCSGYRGVLDAVAEVVAGREASAAATAASTEEARIPHQAPPGAGSVQQQPHPHDGGMA